jgi:hypothetical protein
MNYSTTTATVFNVIDSAFSIAAKAIEACQDKARQEKAAYIAGLTWEGAKVIAHYTEYAFYAACLICYQAGSKTRQILDENLEIWFEARRDEIQDDVEAAYLNIETTDEYRTFPAAQAFLYHAVKPHATAAYRQIRAVAESEQADRAKHTVIGGLKKATHIAQDLASNIREGMFPRLNG